MNRWKVWTLALLAPFLFVIKARLIYWVALKQWDHSAASTVIFMSTFVGLITIVIAAIWETDQYDKREKNER